MEQKIKLGAYLILDDAKEKDLVNTIQEMINNRQLSYFITNLVKFGLENPELLKKAGICNDRVLASNSRSKFFEDVKKDLKELESKVSELSKVTEQEYQLALLGKRLGLEEKAENTLQAQFLLKKQINRLKTILEVDEVEFFDKNASLSSIESRAEDLVEFALNHYSDLLRFNSGVQIVERVVSPSGVESSNEMPKSSVGIQKVVEERVVNGLEEIATTQESPLNTGFSSTGEESNSGFNPGGFDMDNVGDFFG